MMRNTTERQRPVTLAGAIPEVQSVAELAIGTPVLTLDGDIPVEFLEPGDRVITRDGIETLIDISHRWYTGPLIHTGQPVPGRSRHIKMTRLTPETKVLMRDWRTGVIYGNRAALVAAEQLVDGDEAIRVDTAKVRVFALHFASDQVIRSGAQEIACRAQGFTH